MAGENHILVAGYDPSGHSIARPANRDNGPYQYDYGQVLRLEGFGDILPQTFEMHFGTGNGQSVTMIGNDGAVDFPDECLTKHGTVTAWLFLHDTNSDGETRYVIETTVKPRAKITNQEPTPVQQDVITQAIAALNNAVEETSGAVTEASEARDEAVEAAETATNQAAVAGRQALNAFNSAQNAATSAGQASGSASAASRSETAASTSASSANTSANSAGQSADSAAQSADSAAQSAAAAQHSAENIENVVEVSSTEPTHEINKLWIVEESGTPVQVPTYAEHQAKADKADTVLDTTLSRGRKANTFIGNGSIAFGTENTASGQFSSAFGSETVASGPSSHSHGSSAMIGTTIRYTTASGTGSHAEGGGTLASGGSSHAEGVFTTASGDGSHAEGGQTTASGMRSHSEGEATEASGRSSHSEGVFTIANHKSQHVSGEYNIADPSTAASNRRGTYVEIVGNGTADNARSNARTLDWNGNEKLAGDLIINAGTEDEVSVSELAEETNKKYEKPSSGIPASDIASGVIPDVSGKQNAPATAGTSGQVLGLDNELNPVWITPSAGVEIDDTAGEGDTDKAWSADKLSSEFGTLDHRADAVEIRETVSTPADVMTITDGADDIPVDELVVGIEPAQSGSGDPAPDNVRPISGWTGANIYVGQNEYNVSTIITGKVLNATGGIDNSDSQQFITDKIYTNPGDTYTISFTSEYGARTRRVIGFNSNNELVETLYNATWVTVGNKVKSILTIGQDTAYIIFTGYTLDDDIFFGKTPTTYSVSFPTEAGTVYGGTLTVRNDGTGTLVVDRAAFLLSSFTWALDQDTSSENIFRTSVIDTILNENRDNICSKYKVVQKSRNSLLNGELGFYNLTDRFNRFVVKDFQYSSVEDFVSSLGDATIVCYLAETQTYQLTALEVIATLKGTNNIWADTGAIQSIIYSADPKLYVDQHIPEVPVQDVQVNGTSILSDGVANVPLGSNSKLGVFKINPDYGVNVLASGALRTVPAGANGIKQGTAAYLPISPETQHQSVFYGLAKAAGADMASSSNPVGTYTDAAQVAIQKMLGIYEAPWELIREDTFTNAASAIHEFSVDGNGQPFELTSAVIMFETPTQNVESSANGLLVFSDGTKNIAGVYCGGWTQAANAVARGCWMVADGRDGLVFVYGKTPSASTNMGGYAQSYMEDFPYNQAQGIVESENFVIRLIKIGNVTGTGHYKLYGKRKWN